MKPKEDIAYDQFKEMEKRYHTWMNYYSLFNGALLVAYCTILVSTGQVIEMGGAISTENGLTGNVRLFQLECTYWNILALIALLGCFASYCWYLSAIGHYHWIERWRKILMEQDNYPKLDFSDVEICNICNKSKHYHSTFKITKTFIFVVLFAWLCVLIYSIFRELHVGYIVIISIAFIIILNKFENHIHIFIGSDLSAFKDKKKVIWDKYCTLKLLIKENKKWIIIIIIAILILSFSVKLVFC